MEDPLHCDLACALNDTGCTGDLHRVEQRRRLMPRGEESLRANLSEPFSLSGLAVATGTGQRMLEHHFRRINGVIPQTWYHSMKLNKARRDPVRAKAAQERIGDSAMRWGFGHLGRCSGEYRRPLGESARATVQRR